ncbi:MarR family transcriptional regulator [Brevibacillus fluminis]|uniref:MarR family transcriptional regulator n=1 Tax=Brevibacillus fluminis TaxID=511487 RepID=A0A3M8DBH7_9BACL|nr:MarR family transcriptional regulator [Brevibacillus fluminis]RNB84665.1 MarR family transcriptional regulator [Brevibacillus fluminis]
MMKHKSIEQIEHEVTVLMRRADYKRTLDGSKNGIERSAYLLVKQLCANGPLSIGNIAELSGLDISTISRQVAAMENKGLISRLPDEKDSRISLVQATEEGKAALLRAKKHRMEAYTELLEDWTEEDTVHLSVLLARLNRAIEERKKAR